jgi:hypothetical protein
MGEQTSTALRPDELTPHTLHQVYRQIVATAQGSVKVGRHLVAVRGQLGPMNDKGPSRTRVRICAETYGFARQKTRGGSMNLILISWMSFLVDF